MSGLIDSISGMASPWLYVVVALIAAAEAALLIGLVFPGEAALLVGGGRIPGPGQPGGDGGGRRRCGHRR